MPKEVLCSIGVHCDAVAGWLGSYGGEDSPCDISRGVFAAEVGMPRLLKLFDRYELRTSWFIPGHTAESFPRESAMAAEQAMRSACTATRTRTRSRCPGSRRPQSSRAASRFSSGCAAFARAATWRHGGSSRDTNELLLSNGVKYDNSLMHDDHHPYYVRVGDAWTKIDYSQPAESWMKPFTKGEETALVEIPGSWYLDDLPPMLFIKASPNSHGYVNPRDLEQSWRDQFDYIYREEDYAVFPMTIHPDVSGRPQVLLMLERFIEYVNGHDGARWLTYEEVADDFVRRVPPPGAG